MRILYLEAKMFKIAKCILNACFKNPWVLEVMSMLVDINEKIILWLWSPESSFFISEQLFLRTPFFPEHVHWVLTRIAWTLIRGRYFRQILMGHEMFLKIFDGPQNLFLCASFLIFSVNSLKFWVKHAQTSHQGDLKN